MDSFLRREKELLRERWTQVIVLLTCLLMILLVSQQGGTIETQKNLIRVLWDDSKQLNSIRVQDLAKKRDQKSAEPQKGNPEQKPQEDKAAPQPAPNGKRPVQTEKPMRVLHQI